MRSLSPIFCMTVTELFLEWRSVGVQGNQVLLHSKLRGVKPPPLTCSQICGSVSWAEGTGTTGLCCMRCQLSSLAFVTGLQFMSHLLAWKLAGSQQGQQHSWAKCDLSPRRVALVLVTEFPRVTRKASPSTATLLSLLFMSCLLK